MPLSEAGHAEAKEAGRLLREGGCVRWAAQKGAGIARPKHAAFHSAADPVPGPARHHSYDFDVAYTSVLKRAISTLWHVLGELDLHWIPVHRDWRLNERHYGALQGLNKAETAAKHGADQVKIWRRSYATPPPELEESASTPALTGAAPRR